MDSLLWPLKSMFIIGPTGCGKTPPGNHMEKIGIGKKRCLHFDFGCQLRAIVELDFPPDGFGRKEWSLFISLYGV